MTRDLLHRIGYLLRRTWLALFITFSLVFVLHQLLANAEQLRTPLRLSPGPLLAAAGLQALFWVFSGFFWRSLVARFSAHTITLPQSIAQLSLLSIGKYLPGKVWGMVARGAHLTRLGVSASAEGVVAATIYEQLVILHSALILSGTSLSVLFLDATLALALSSALLASAFLGPRLLPLALRLYRHVSRRVSSANSAGPSPPMPTVNPLAYNTHILGYSAIWLLNGLVLAALYVAFFSPLSDVRTLALIVSANTVSITAGFLALFAPGGVGVREAVASGILVAAMPWDDAILLSILFRTWLIVVDLLLGGIFVFTLTPQPSKQKALPSAPMKNATH